MVFRRERTTVVARWHAILRPYRAERPLGKNAAATLTPINAALCLRHLDRYTGKAAEAEPQHQCSPG